MVAQLATNCMCSFPCVAVASQLDVGSRGPALVRVPVALMFRGTAGDGQLKPPAHRSTVSTATRPLASEASSARTPSWFFFSGFGTAAALFYLSMLKRFLNVYQRLNLTSCLLPLGVEPRGR